MGDLDPASRAWGGPEDGRARRLRCGGKAVRWVEFALLAVAAPLAVRLGLVPVHPFVLLWAVAALAAAALALDPAYPTRELVHVAGLRRCAGRIAMRALVAAALLGLAIALLTPEMLLGFVRRAPERWALVTLLYPFLSVYPQGIVYRAFILHRYGPLAAAPAGAIVLSAAAFGFMHVVLANPLAPLLTFVAGLALADTHVRSRSLLASSLEHALYGWLVFTLGWGGLIYLAR